MHLPGSLCDALRGDVLTAELAVFPAEDFVIYAFVKITPVNPFKNGARLGQFLKMRNFQIWIILQWKEWILTGAVLLSIFPMISSVKYTYFSGLSTCSAIFS